MRGSALSEWLGKDTAWIRFDNHTGGRLADLREECGLVELNGRLAGDELGHVTFTLGLMWVKVARIMRWPHQA